mmetsp:Transcript_64305/g.135067  ORF Transcript_64305/g.135067 Transcript_64305/m.135067 type:complete len:542 (+) Transcript_64305:115-1740(+)|eukprot:CAMPEP_0206490824 /NCGR_PEP_ID=MMETSP0324_2-20121206/44430_1 /ASSEMBLY_ACC=CAM_ASM_000836 /TAXON_ID=2866 /ORGANISM="Crypthecodinium cohnii, Strain Seligo" /LENGTH=541 /DNA_ID=CAMNT_0053971497 /DNA_START=46 /DNA_END=1671 /DNA_ORIENTATION=+
MAAPEDSEVRWSSFWSKLLATFEEEAGDPPDDDVEDWEKDLLDRLFHEQLGAKQPRGPLAARGKTLAACQASLRRAAERRWNDERAAQFAAEAKAKESERNAPLAIENWEKAIASGPSRPWEARLALSWLQLVALEEGGEQLCEQQLRLALDEARGQAKSSSCNKSGETVSPKKRRKVASTPAAPPASKREVQEVLTRLCVLLCQQGRDDDVRSLLREGGWEYRLSRSVFHYPYPDPKTTLQDVASASNLAKLPCYAVDGTLPEAMCEELKQIFGRDSTFWKEHRYNSLSRCSSEDVGYFSYTHDLNDTNREITKLDVAIRHIQKVASAHFPELEEAKYAEWWAHCRPHASGHQMHYDSDNEGIGGARHPICSCVVYLEGGEDLGGPTLVTTQRLGDSRLSNQGWLVFPRAGRICAFDASVLHGVVPGRGLKRSSEARRVSWMVAFWRDVRIRPFEEDGLPGSSRPLPSTSGPFEMGKRRYTWHQQLRLDGSPEDALRKLEVPATLEAVVPVPVPNVWEPVEKEGSLPTESMPEYDKCFQF